MALRSDTTEYGLNGISLCTGIAGIDLGLKISLGTAYRTVCYVEREASCAANLVARMEVSELDKAPIWDDLETFECSPWCGIVDLISGGYPCQPFSLAGKRLGEDDKRHLWPYVSRIVSEVKPAFCFFENVSGHLSLGFAEVKADLEAMGYAVEAGLFTAAEVGAPHKRQRLFVLAYNDKLNCYSSGLDASSVLRGKRETSSIFGYGKVANPYFVGQQRERISEVLHQERTSLRDNTYGCMPTVADSDWRYSNQEQAVCAGRTATSMCGSNVADSNGLAGRRQHELESSQRTGTRQQSSGYCAELEHTHDTGRKEQWGGEFDTRPTFPPSPADSESWERIIRIDPSLAPATQRQVRRMVDELSTGMDLSRADRLRSLGNAVVPTVAAYAFCYLLSGLRDRVHAKCQ